MESGPGFPPPAENVVSFAFAPKPQGARRRQGGEGRGKGMGNGSTQKARQKARPECRA